MTLEPMKDQAALKFASQHRALHTDINTIRDFPVFVMSANGVRASSVASNSENSLVGASGYKFKKDGKKSTQLKLKRPPAPAMKRQDSDMTGSKDGGASSRSSSPILPNFEDEIVINGNDTLETVICKHCKKPVLKRTAKEHMVGCLKSKQDKARKKKEARDKAQRAKAKAEGADEDDDEDDDVKGSARKGASQGDGADDGAKKGKKRKAEEEADAANKKKKTKKEEQKPKAVKPKGPVEVEKQCGVQLPNGGQCARSLTCKSHSMGAKRAVPGRSLPYDMLLQAYQKKNQARQQKAAIDANAPLLFDDEEHDPSLAGPVDSDEERDAVMSAVSRAFANPQPLVPQTLFPTRRKYQLVRMKEMLSNALGGNRGSGGMFGVSAESANTAYPRSAMAENFPSAIPNSASIAQKSSMRKATLDVG